MCIRDRGGGAGRIFRVRRGWHGRRSRGNTGFPRWSSRGSRCRAGSGGGFRRRRQGSVRRLRRDRLPKPLRWRRHSGRSPPPCLRRLTGRADRSVCRVSAPHRPRRHIRSGFPETAASPPTRFVGLERISAFLSDRPWQIKGEGFQERDSIFHRFQSCSWNKRLKFCSERPMKNMNHFFF